MIGTIEMENGKKSFLSFNQKGKVNLNFNGLYDTLLHLNQSDITIANYGTQKKSSLIIRKEKLGLWPFSKLRRRTKVKIGKIEKKTHRRKIEVSLATKLPPLNLLFLENSSTAASFWMATTGFPTTH